MLNYIIRLTLALNLFFVTTTAVWAQDAADYGVEIPATPTPYTGTVTTSQDFGDTEVNSAGANAFSIVVALLAGVMGLTYGKSCANQPSAWVFNGGSLAYIVQEGISLFSFIKNVDKEKLELELRAELSKNHPSATEQMMPFTMAAQQCEVAIGLLDGKKTALKTFAIVSFVAAAVALVELILAIIPTVNYDATCRGTRAAYTDPFSIFDSPEFYAHTIPYAPRVSPELQLLLLEAKEVVQSLLAAGVNLAFPAANAEEAMTEEEMEEKAERLEKISKLAAGAAMIPSIIKLIMLIVKVAQGPKAFFEGLKHAGTEAATKESKSSAIIRISIFTTFGILASVAHGVSDNVQETYRNRKEAYNDIFNQLVEITSQVPNYGDVNFDPSKLNFTMPEIEYEVPEIPNGGLCFDQQSNADEACKCLKTKSCLQTPDIAIDKKFPEFKAFDPGISNLISTIPQGANQITHGNTSGGVKLMNDSAGRQGLAKVQSVVNRLKDHLNRDLVKKGQKPVDWKGMEKHIQKGFLDATKKAINNLSPSEKKEFQQFTGTGMVKEPQAKTKEAKKAVAKVQKSVKIPKKNLGKQAPNGTSDDDLGDFMLMEDEKEQKKTTDDNPLAQYESNVQDIHKKPDVSIFKILEVRYFKTGYPILLEEVKK